MVILRTHGGLGNQIFQLLYARLYSEQNKAVLGEIHDSNYKHHFPRSLELSSHKAQLSFLQRLLSLLRLPKILNRIGTDRVEKVKLMGSIFLDGYFQSENQYKLFKPEKITQELIRIRNELKISNIKKEKFLIHLRLGDFFESFEESKIFALTRLRDLPLGATIITNQEILLTNSEVKFLIDKANCKVVSTIDFTPEEIIRFMSKFENIIANDSTLTFWAAVLGGCKVDFRNPELSKLSSIFKGYLCS